MIGQIKKFKFKLKARYRSQKAQLCFIQSRALKKKYINIHKMIRGKQDD